MQFSDIPGLPETKINLLNAVQNNHLAHALLFSGPEGSSNLTMALALTTYINCQNKSDHDSCGSCAPCQKMKRLVLPDLNFAFPLIARSKENEVEAEEKDEKFDALGSWRKFVIEQPHGNIHDYIYFNGFEKKQLNISKAAAKEMIQALSLMSFEGGYKIMLIWAPEYLHPAAANALLKIIEEPPVKTVFMLVTSQPDKLLTTILSRTQRVMVRAYTDMEVKDHLVQKGLADSDVANQIAMLADGNMREVYRMLDQAEDFKVSFIRNWFRLCHGKKLKEIFTLSDEFQKLDKEAQKSLMLTGLNVIREILLKNFALDSLLRTSGEDRDFIDKISINVLKEDHVNLLYSLFNDAHYHLERSGNPKLIFTDLSMQITILLAKID